MQAKFVRTKPAAVSRKGGVPRKRPVHSSGATESGPGRPPRGKTASEYRMQVRLVLPEELREIKEAAAICGQEHASTWVRDLALQAAAEVRRSGKGNVVITVVRS